MSNRQLSLLHCDFDQIVNIHLVRPIQDYAKSSVAVAEYQLQTSEGDLLLAREYLERVAGSNAEEAGQAGELLKVVKLAMEERKTGETAGQARNSDV